MSPTDAAPTQRIELAPEPAQVREARAFTAGALVPVVGSGDAAEELLHRAATVTSELVANAIRAGATSIALELSFSADAVRIAVVDDASGEITISEPDPLALSGRGMHIIASYSRTWGVCEAPGAGPRKSVWAELELPRSENTDPPAEGNAMTGASDPVLRLVGDLDLVSEAETLSQIDRFLLENPEVRDLVLDLADLGFVDSRGMAIFVHAHTSALARGGGLTLIRVPPITARALRSHGLDAIFDIRG